MIQPFMLPASIHVFRNGFLLFRVLSLFDLMGWTFLALLCDYALGMLLIMALFYIFKAHDFGLRLPQKHLASAHICFHMGRGMEQDSREQSWHDRIEDCQHQY